MKRKLRQFSLLRRLLNGVCQCFFIVLQGSILVLFISLLIFLPSCQEGKEERLIHEIYKIQQRNYEIRKDTSFVELSHAQKLIQENENIPDTLKAENEYLLGLCYEKKGNLDSAVIFFHNATTYVQDEIKTDREVDYFYDAWAKYFQQELFGDCITISDRFIALLDKEKDFEWLVLAYYCKENVYKKTREYENALINNSLRINILDSIGDPNNYLPNALISTSETKFDQGKKEEAIAILENLIAQPEILNNDHKRQLYGNYGTYHFRDKNYEKALDHYFKSLSFKKREKKNSIATSYCNITEAYLKLKRYDEARIYLDSVKFLGLNNIKPSLLKSFLKYEYILKVATNEGFNKISTSIDDILDFREKQQKKYKKDLRELKLSNEKEIKLLEKQQESKIENFRYKTILGALLVLLPILIVATFLFFRQRKYKFEQDNILMHQRLLRAQMKPHFIFNFLSAIQAQIKESPKLATNYLIKFSKLLRLILENSSQNYVELDKELESLTKYMDLQLLRFPEKFKYKIHWDKPEEESVFIPPMLLQPIVENCIEHGFSNTKYLGEIEIKLQVEGEFIHTVIEDNGIGIQERMNPKKKTSSIQLISDFLEKATKQKIEIVNKSDLSNQDTGLRVSLLIPFKFYKND